MNGKLKAGAVAIVSALVITGGLYVVENREAHAQSNDWGPKWTSGGDLILPTGFHEWIFLGSPITPNGLNGGEAGFPEYHNVYVQPQAFRHYKESGEWPVGTILLKELQLTKQGTFDDGSRAEVSGRGYFPGALNGIDISVHDPERFGDTNDWGFFNFGHHAPPYAASAPALPADACAGCHIANATDMVFIEFYKPILSAR